MCVWCGVCVMLVIVDCCCMVWCRFCVGLVVCGVGLCGGVVVCGWW